MAFNITTLIKTAKRSLGKKNHAMSVKRRLFDLPRPELQFVTIQFLAAVKYYFRLCLYRALLRTSATEWVGTI